MGELVIGISFDDDDDTVNELFLLAGVDTCGTFRFGEYQFPGCIPILLHKDQWELIGEEVDGYFAVTSPQRINAINTAWRDALEKYRRKTDWILENLSKTSSIRPASTKHPKKDRGGYVYILEGGGYYKIGRTKDLGRRFARIEPALPFEVDVFHIIECDDYVAMEMNLHLKFAKQRTNGEWFVLSQEDLSWLKTL